MKHALRILLLLLTLNAPALAAGKFQVAWGYFNVKAETSKASGSLNNFGAYQLGYRREFAPKLEFGIGYSLVVQKIVSGDMGFGPDLGLFYFPFTTVNGFRFENDDVLVNSSELWRPYTGLSFHQRQYQSTQSNYAGFSMTLGTEYDYSKDFSLKGEFRSSGLTGPSDARSTETTIVIGISTPF